MNNNWRGKCLWLVLMRSVICLSFLCLGQLLSHHWVLFVCWLFFQSFSLFLTYLSRVIIYSRVIKDEEELGGGEG